MANIILAQIGHDLGGGLKGIGPLGDSGSFAIGASSNPVMTLFSKVISNLIGFLTVIAGIYFTFQLIFAAYEWITAGGDTQKLQHAQKKILNSVIGLVIVIVTIFLVDLIGALLGIDILNPIPTIKGLW